MSARLGNQPLLVENGGDALAIAASSTTSNTVNYSQESNAAPQMFTPRKSLAAVATAASAAAIMLQSVSHVPSVPLQSPRTSTPQIQPFQPIPGHIASIVASVRSHVSTRPSSFLSSPSTVTLVSPKSVVQTSFEPTLQQSQPYQMPRDVPRSLKDSYSRDAEMWGEHVSPQPPVVVSLPSLWKTPVRQGQPLNGLDSASLSGAFDQVSPVGDIVERSRTPETNPVIHARRAHVEQEWLPTAYRREGAVQSPRQQRDEQMRSPSPETIAIKEATAVRTI
jgi:hypothetical protein